MNLKTRFFIYVFLLVITTQYHADAQISPGELSKVHAHLEGMSNCTKCHILGKKVSNQKCLECHTEIKARIEQKKGYHSSAEIKGKECVTCHSDHHGLNFQIVRFAKEKFNHNLSGFSLTGAHAKKQCIDCHKPGFIQEDKIKKKKFTYLGLTPNCLTCHTDYHQQTLSSSCSDCHDFEAFKPAKKFDHTKAKFQLTGKHQTVLCISCHKTGTKNGQKFQEFKGIKFDNCTNCHKDVHNNKFGQNCTQCHTEQSFSIIKGVQNFDHDKTDFKLDGKHRNVACNACHKTKLTNALKFGRCTDCHSDYHKNQFAKQGVSPDCSQCHTVNGFTGSTFTVAQHNEGVFPLKGAHLATPCFACHKKEAPKADTTWHFRDIGKLCIDCHQNIHQTFISEKYYPGANCEICHNESKWSAINFDHQKTNFELSGAHAKKTCRDCHFKKDNAGVVLQRFTGLSTGCANCHDDIHAKQFESNGTTDCSRCHDMVLFKPATKFDHKNTLFPLDGKHKDVACNKCHKVIQDKGPAFVLYKIREFKCENCHH
ncbi:MAG: cytochrome C [Bacteroidetes bacterium]|nr:cytochrome C [Bacteroidota bacterium]